LNINSLSITKLQELNQICELDSFDLIFLNETKISSETPESFFAPKSYNILRRDRESNGGGVMVLYKKSFKLKYQYNLKKIEAINFQISIKDVDYNFVCCYNPHFSDCGQFLVDLEDYLIGFDMSKPLFVVGDLNIDMLTEKKKSSIDSFCHLFECHNVIEKPTREVNTVLGDSSSLIDVVLHNSSLVHSNDVVFCPFSDHKFVCCALETPSISFPFQPEFTGLSYSDKNREALSKLLKKTDFSKIFELENPNEKLHEFNRAVTILLDICCPIKTYKIKDKDNFPWNNPELLSRKNERDYLFSLWCASRCPLEWDAYKKARACWQKCNRESIVEYYKSKGASDFKNSKKYWEFYRTSIRVKSDIAASNCPSRLNYDGSSATSPDEISNLFNKFFSSIKSTSPINVDLASKKIEEYFSRLKREGKLFVPDSLSFSFAQVTMSEVEEALNSMSATSSPGYNGIHPKVLKLVPEVFLPIFTDLFNCCIKCGVIPDDFKFAIVIPLFKKGDPADINNYRGISILPFLAKLFEKLIANQIKKYFESNNLFYSGQHGFRRGHSCETALHEILTDLNIARDQRKIIMLLFIDYCKAFDTVDSQLLLHKFFQYGFDNVSLRLLGNYFSQRMQTIKPWDNKSVSKLKPCEITLGVPQGSCLGPLFFLIFINDLPHYLELSAKLFADDTTLYKVGDDLDQLVHDFSKQSELLLEWCAINRLDINWKKTFAMFVTNKRIVLPKSVKIGEIDVEVVKEFKLLGVTIDNTLSFTTHVANTCKVINRKLYSIKRLFYLATSVKLQFFKSFIMPYFDYCATLYLYYPKVMLQRLSNMYFFCLFKLFKWNFHDDVVVANKFLNDHGLFTLQHRILIRFATFAWKQYMLDGVPSELKKQITSDITCVTSPSQQQKHNFHELRPTIKTRTVDNSDNNTDNTIENNTKMVIIQRSKNIFSKDDVSILKYGEMTFGKFFKKLISECIRLDNIVVGDLKNFLLKLHSNLDQIFINFIRLFFKFDLYIKNFVY
jgi:hypothetical protein